MPVWGPVISDQQVAELVAYIKAGLPPVAGVQNLEVPADASPEVAGALLYQARGSASTATGRTASAACRTRARPTRRYRR